MQHENPSGITPIEYNVLLKQDDVQEKTEGGLHLPQQTLEVEKHTQTRGEIVAVSPMAFEFDDWPGDVAKPHIGQRVIFGKHSGVFVKGNDGVEYRVIKDKDVVAVMA